MKTLRRKKYKSWKGKQLVLFRKVSGILYQFIVFTEMSLK